MCLLAAGGANLLRTSVEGSVAGPKVCKTPCDPVCEQKAAPEGFPAPTAMQSRRAWNGKQQPTNLQCWPRRPDGFPEPCPYQQVTVLEDTINKWPGRCENMRRVTDLGPNETCKMRCYSSALCGVWSVENVTAGVPVCWQALYGTNCYKGNFPPPMRAQRIMHGSVRMLMNAMEMLIKNLTKAFDTNDVGNNATLGEKDVSSCARHIFSANIGNTQRSWDVWLRKALYGTNCYKGNFPPPMRAQRIMHGSVRMLMNAMEMLIKNLTKAFDTNDVGNNATLGAERCEFVCSSYLFCQYWQYSTKLGCLVEDPAAKEVAYPMVTDTWAMETDTADANSVKAGQYIQHTCNVGPRIPLPTDSSGTKPPAVVTHPSSEPATDMHYRDSARSEKGTVGSQSPSQSPFWWKLFMVVGIALCLASVAGGAYMAIVGHNKGARGVAGGSRKAGSLKRSQRAEHSCKSPSVGDMNKYGEPVAWQQGETVPFMQNQNGQDCHGQRLQQHQCSNYANSFPRPRQTYMPTQAQMYQPMQQQGYQGHL
eukprot:CAMPEP_0172780862 /NCGR_PEP_ID=MMETSP1074-20121228/203141_1 /TAXON_ID=2916 /ORGANISM="Ceratium fusus, Strain PA161109" /LENGTH=534 /DNA_ID=CAMNT_0013617839 /DNA_START=245 /DNA_END=1850 /DNA_ORIENTATION=-